MIERVVENWLTSANECQYQIPFCQLLASESESIIYVFAFLDRSRRTSSR